MDQNTDSNKLLRFFKETLNKIPPVAPAELFYDSQCKRIIAELKTFQNPIKLLDYGCGNLRLLNGILNSNETLPNIEYTGTDVQPPERSARRILSKPNEFKKLKNVRELKENSFDVIILMNVIHEIAIHDIALIFEDIRRLLSPDGKLFLVDMSILPEGEPLALPFFSWEFEDLFESYEDKSYVSKTGIPVIFLEIHKQSIPFYPSFLEKLNDLFQLKRNTFSDIACKLNNPRLLREYKHLLPKLSLSGDKVYDLGKLMLMSGHANYRWVEEKNREKNNYVDVADAAVAILELFFDKWHKEHKIISPADIFNLLGSTYNYDCLSFSLTNMSNNIGCFFFPYTDRNAPLIPTESIEAFEDHYEYEDIKKMGLGMLQMACHNKVCWN